MTEYIDDSNGPDLIGRSIVWQMGMIAWNIHVTGRQKLAECAFSGSQLDAEQQEIVRKEIVGLVQRKIEIYPRQRTAIRDVVATLVNGSPRAKARPGDTFPELPPMPANEPRKPITAEYIAALRKEMKLTQAKFGELFGVTARKVSEWEHGKSLPDNFVKRLENCNISEWQMFSFRRRRKDCSGNNLNLFFLEIGRPHQFFQSFPDAPVESPSGRQ